MMRASALRERERERHGVTEGERTIFIILIGLRVKNCFFFFLCLALSYYAHLSIDVHCSNGAKKSKNSSTAACFFLVFWWS